MVVDKPVSSVRSLGSLASVEDLKSGRQGLTVFVLSSVLLSAISGVLFGFDNNFISEYDGPRALLPATPRSCTLSFVSCSSY